MAVVFIEKEAKLTFLKKINNLSLSNLAISELNKIEGLLWSDFINHYNVLPISNTKHKKLKIITCNSFNLYTANLIIHNNKQHQIFLLANQQSGEIIPVKPIDW